MAWTGLLRASACVALLARAPAMAQELTEATFDRWSDYLAPEKSECAWEGVPWRPSFRAGVRDSQIEGRPILLWAMNGHPMGCV